MQRETWVGIAWAVGLFAAMAAVFAYEAATFELEEFHVAYETTDAGGTASDTLLAGSSDVYMFEVDGRNLTYVEIELAWTDPNGADDVFMLMVTDGNGTTTMRNSATGSIILRQDGVVIPDQDHIEGVNLAHARQSDLAAPQNATALHGTWRVEVLLESAPPVASGAPTAPVMGCGAPQQPACDGSNAYTLTWRVMHYHATFPSDDEAHE